MTQDITSRETGQVSVVLLTLARVLLWFGLIMLGLSVDGVIAVGWSKVAMMVMLYVLAAEALLMR